MEKNTKIAVGVGLVAALAIGAFGGAVFTPQDYTPESVQVSIDAAVSNANSTAFNAGVDSVEPEVVIEENTVYEDREVTVEVDNGNLDLVLDHIYDNKGDVEYLTEDLDDDEVAEIVDRISFINDVKVLAAEEVKAEAIDLLHKEDVGDVRLDEDDIERLRIDGDADEIELDDVEFEDLDADAFVNARFEQDDVKYEALFRVEIKDGVVDDIDLVELGLKE